MNRDSHLARWGALYILAVLFLGSWLGQLVTQLQVQRNEAEEHGQPFDMADFWPQFFASTFENWQSEFLQLMVQALLLLGPLAYVLWRADQNADKRDLDEINDKLDRLLDKQVGDGSPPQA